MPCVCVCSVCCAYGCCPCSQWDHLGYSDKRRVRLLSSEADVWKEDHRNWTRSLIWGPSGRRWNRQKWTSFIPETLGGIWEVLCCIQGLWRKFKNPCLHSFSMICVILLITAHSITVRGERPSSTFRHLAAWLQLTGWCLSCGPSSSSGPCWPSKHGAAS